MPEKRFCRKGHDTWICGRNNRHTCNQCYQESTKRWRKVHPEYYQEYYRNKYQNDPGYREKIRAQSKTWREQNPDRFKKLVQVWYENHPEASRTGEYGFDRIRAWGSPEYQEWREACLKRDGYKCVVCDTKPDHLYVHHIKPWRYYPELRYEVSNGTTLCLEHHAEVDPYFYNFVRGQFEGSERQSLPDNTPIN